MEEVGVGGEDAADEGEVGGVDCAAEAEGWVDPGIVDNNVRLSEVKLGERDPGWGDGRTSCGHCRKFSSLVSWSA